MVRAVLSAACLTLGCAGGLSTSQPAHVPKKGHSQAEMGMDVSFSTGTMRKVLRAARSLEQAAQTRTLSDAEKRAILTGATELAINPPAIIPHLGFATSLFDRWELGLRLATSGWRFGVRHQLLLQEQSGVDLSVGLGGGLALFTPPVEDALETVTITDFARWNLDAPVVVGQHGSWYRWWAGPRFFYSHFSQELHLELPNDEAVSAAIGGDAFYVGGLAGAAFGYRSVFIGPEIVVVGLVGSAHMEALGSRTDVNFDGLVIYPAFAVMGEF